MAHIPSIYVITLFLYSLINYASSQLRLDVYTTPAQIGSVVEFDCFGKSVQQAISNGHFTNGSKLAWFADNKIIGYSSVVDNQYVKYIVDANMMHKYNITVYRYILQGVINTFFTFKINNVLVADEKSYRCALLSAQNDTESESKEQFLEVHFAPTSSHPLCNADCTDSDSVTLTCRSETASPPVQLYWMTKTDGIISNASSESDGFTEAKLVIQPLSNNKSFECGAGNYELFPGTYSEYICVSNYTGVYAPSARKCEMHSIISITQSKTEFTEGDEAVFKCNIAAAPNVEQEIIWDFSPQIKPKTMTTDFNNSVSTLSIMDVTVADNGSFVMCINYNKLGRNFENRTLVVRRNGSSGMITKPHDNEDDDAVKTVTKILPKNGANRMSQLWKPCLLMIFAELLSFV